MTLNHRNLLLVLVLSLAILMGACSPAQSNASVIATSVAATVQAQATAAAAATPTPLPVTQTIPALTTPVASATQPPPTAPTGSGSNLCTASASFISETIPDGTIESPGAVFTKTWRIQNTGTCPWDSTWKWVFVSGDLLGGATLYNFPAPASPGATVDVPVVFTAPADSGTYRGYWKIQSPWGMLFGDSGSGNAFWVDIVVGSGTPANSKTQTVFGVTAVTYDVSRRCTTANTFWTVTAHISSNGPVTAIYSWIQSDGNNKANNKLVFDQATTLSVSRDWSQSITSSDTPRWMQIIVTSPTYQEFSKSPSLILCGH